MNREDATLAMAVIAVVLQAVSVWQNRKRKPKGKHRRE